MHGLAESDAGIIVHDAVPSHHCDRRMIPVLSRRILVCTAALLASGAMARGAHAVTFTDAAGDSGTGPDITAVSVVSETAGTVSLEVQLGNRPSPSPGLELQVNIDVDPAGGDPEFGGADFGVGAADAGFYFARWTGSEWQPVPGAFVSRIADGRGVQIALADLGSPASLRFWVGVSDNADDPANWDAAPDAGFFTFEVTPAIQGMTVPATVLLPRAGRMYAVPGLELLLTNDEIVRPDRITCQLTRRGRVLTPLAGGCRWRLASELAGKKLLLRVTLSYQGQTITQTFPVVPQAQRRGP
jgi:hypothetical protein